MYTQAATTQLEWFASMDPVQHKIDNKYLRKTSIICTIGPKTKEVPMLQKLRKSGMNIVRLNASHGDHAYFQNVIDNVHQVEREEPGRPLAIALDTKGPEMRTGVMENNEDQPIEEGHELIVTTDKAYAEKCSTSHLYIDYERLPERVVPDRVIYIDDGILALRVVSVEGKNVRVVALNNGVLSSRKGVNLPLTEVDLPAVSEKDRKDLEFARDQRLDMIFASFIRCKEDVESIRKILGKDGEQMRIIAKIENHQGLVNFDEILEVADGIMVARGDLGIEIPAPQVFLAQKMMISRCNIMGKPVICATQMLESMTINNRPTRAEVSDVANAVVDGADCVMLSGETAKGKYPCEAVKMMAETTYIAEQSLSYQALFNEMRSLTRVPTNTQETIALVAVSASLEQRAGAILLMSTSGNTARLVSKYRPQCPILMVTRNSDTARSCHLYRGTYPFHYPLPKIDSPAKWQEDVDNRVKFGLSEALKLNIINKGDTVIAVQGWRGGQGFTNSLRVVTVPTSTESYILEDTTAGV
ncbi:pyruvate kinase [Malassezia psittaci]|uniref:Pyruvate kinase n=1 Tax=Malassezia psittaci TaxID=1821823 RepID=A0AAF0JE30_9BASI|nr:pyruvate kinase [Malassezia psittaci]